MALLFVLYWAKTNNIVRVCVNCSTWYFCFLSSPDKKQKQTILWDFHIYDTKINAHSIRLATKKRHWSLHLLCAHSQFYYSFPFLHSRTHAPNNARTHAYHTHLHLFLLPSWDLVLPTPIPHDPLGDSTQDVLDLGAAADLGGAAAACSHNDVAPANASSNENDANVSTIVPTNEMRQRQTVKIWICKICQ